VKVKEAIEQTFKIVSENASEKMDYKSGCTAVMALIQERLIESTESDNNQTAQIQNDDNENEEDDSDKRKSVIEQIWFANCGDARAVSCRNGIAMYVLRGGFLFLFLLGFIWVIG
jgi:serine/threonine protein phosphatase PrpC